MRFVRVRSDHLEGVCVPILPLTSPSTVNVTMCNPSVLDDTRRPGAVLKSMKETLNGKVPGLEHRASRFCENIDAVQQDDNATHDTDPALPLVSSNARARGIGCDTTTCIAPQLTSESLTLLSAQYGDLIGVNNREVHVPYPRKSNNATFPLHVLPKMPLTTDSQRARARPTRDQHDQRTSSLRVGWH